jgi:hypothetical protein
MAPKNSVAVETRNIVDMGREYNLPYVHTPRDKYKSTRSIWIRQGALAKGFSFGFER